MSAKLFIAIVVVAIILFIAGSAAQAAGQALVAALF